MNYDRSGNGNGNNYNRQGNNYNNSWGNNYERRENDYNAKPPRSSYDNYSRSYDNSQRMYDGNRQSNSVDDSSAKKRRPRVGEVPVPVKNNNYYSGHQNSSGYYNRDNRDNRGGYQQQRPNNNRPFNRNSQGNRNNVHDPNAKYGQKKQLKYREEHFDLNEPIRLNKYLSNSGVCSRREADEFIQIGRAHV